MCVNEQCQLIIVRCFAGKRARGEGHNSHTYPRGVDIGVPANLQSASLNAVMAKLLFSAHGVVGVGLSGSHFAVSSKGDGVQLWNCSRDLVS